MDKEQEENQCLGFFGIIRESISIAFSYTTIFSQITLFIILPLCFISLSQIEISEFLLEKIINVDYTMDRIQVGSETYSKISDILLSEWTKFWLFKITYYIIFAMFSLISTSAVVYTVACIYTSQEITIKKVICMVPKVWNRLVVTFMWNFIIILAWNIVALLVLILWAFILGPGDVGLETFVILGIIYLMGFVYIGIIWHLASVVSVLEDIYGIQAMFKSIDLIKGNIGISAAFFLLLDICYIGIQQGFEMFVVNEKPFGEPKWQRIAWLVLLSMLVLFGFIIQTVIYFVCKSYHHENVDRLSFGEHLEVCFGDYVPLESKDLQQEAYIV